MLEFDVDDVFHDYFSCHDERFGVDGAGGSNGAVDIHGRVDVVGWD